ncbi:MAG: hypothetical protein KA312_01990 [Sphingorhabdus sp.]|nr:hypothetical protein [Sphingorhabdus sp.]
MIDKSFDRGPIADGIVAQHAYDIRETLHGTVDGVAIDFRHELLVPGEWKPYPQWHVWGDGGPNISILLPEEGAHSDEELREVKGISPDFPILRAEAGDTIFVADAQRVEQDRAFDHPHDREYRYARLVLRKPDGSTVEAPALIGFVGALSVRGAIERDVFDNVLERIRRHIGVGSLYDEMPDYYEFNEAAKVLAEAEKAKVELSRHAQKAGKTAHHSYSTLQDYIELLPVEHRTKFSAVLRVLLSSATRAGFTLAKMEAQQAERVAAAPLRNLEKAQAARRDPRRIAEASALWAKHPRATTNWIAKNIALPDDDVSSVSRSIKHLAPSTSPSFKG